MQTSIDCTHTDLNKFLPLFQSERTLSNTTTREDHKWYAGMRPTWTWTCCAVRDPPPAVWPTIYSTNPRASCKRFSKMNFRSLQNKNKNILFLNSLLIFLKSQQFLLILLRFCRFDSGNGQFCHHGLPHSHVLM